MTQKCVTIVAQNWFSATYQRRILDHMCNDSKSTEKQN